MSSFKVPGLNGRGIWGLGPSNHPTCAMGLSAQGEGAAAGMHACWH